MFTDGSGYRESARRMGVSMGRGSLSTGIILKVILTVPECGPVMEPLNTLNLKGCRRSTISNKHGQKWHNKYLSGKAWVPGCGQLADTPAIVPRCPSAYCWH